MTANNAEKPDNESAVSSDSTAGAPRHGRPDRNEAADEQDPDAEVDHAARAELLAEENRRLRSEYARSQQSKYRQTAYGLAAVGVLAVLGGILFPTGREVLFALGATGLFGAVLTRYLTPTTFVAADVGERVYAAMATNEQAIADELGLTGDPVYVPDDANVAALYVPQHSERDVPDASAGPIVIDEGSRGLLLEPTGASLFAEFERALTGDLADAPPVLVEQLADGVVEQFELASAVEPDVDPANGRVTFEVVESSFGDLDRFDHPVASFFAVGLVAALDRPVTVDVTAADDRVDWLVTCRWDVD